MQVYQQYLAADEYSALYAVCQCTSGIYYRGSLGQEQLAQELLGVSVLAYPNTFAETSCIAVMEALAAGLLVVSSDLGALPETCQGFARLIQPVGPSRSREAFARDFVLAIDAALVAIERDPAGFAARQAGQASTIAATCNWDARAAEWEQAARGWMTRHG
jgi:glycosyltransferase involved in cell wall biosynthesis